MNVGLTPTPRIPLRRVAVDVGNLIVEGVTYTEPRPALD